MTGSATLKYSINLFMLMSLLVPAEPGVHLLSGWTLIKKIPCLGSALCYKATQFLWGGLQQYAMSGCSSGGTAVVRQLESQWFDSWLLQFTCQSVLGQDNEPLLSECV